MSGTTMSLDEIYIDSKELIEKRPLGGGGYGMVSLCHRKNHGLVVLKTVYTGPQRMEFNGSLLNEGKMMHKLNHERVIKLIGIILEDGNYSLVMEFMVNGNLLQLLKSVTIPLSVKGRIILEIIEGMTYLHNMHIVHKDLKPENILVDANFQIKIADLGVSIFKTWSQLTTEELKRRRQMSSKLQNNAGTLAYLAPEHLESLKTKATEKSDVYSFSIVVWVILANREPYEHAVNDIQVMHLVQNGDRPDLELIPKEVPEVLVSLMQQCWEKQPADRLTFAECNLQFQPFYEQNFQRFIDEDVERLRELTQETPTASRQLVKRMTSLQVDCVGLMPDTPTRDDPFSLHSSQVASANGHSLEGSFTAGGLSQPVEKQLDSSCESREEEQVRRKLEDELRYHKTGSWLDASMPAGILDEMMKERSKRVSNEPAFGSSYPALATGPPRAEPNEDLYISQDSIPRLPSPHFPSADVSRPIKEETNFQHPSKYSYPGFLVDYRPTLQTPAIVPTPCTAASSNLQHRTWNQYPCGVSGTLHESDPYVGNYIRNPVSQMEQSNLKNFGQGTLRESDPYVGNYIRNPVSQMEQSNLKNFGQEGQHSICLSHTKGVQIGDNNTMYVEKKVTKKTKDKVVKPPRQTANAPLQQNLDGRPVTESHLDLLRGELGKDWKHCARKLGFREPEIDEIDHDYERDGLKEKVFKMLHKWQMKEGFKGATVGKVVQALLSCKRSDLVIHLQKCS